MGDLWDRFSKFLRLYDGVQLTATVLLLIAGVSWNAIQFILAKFTNARIDVTISTADKTELFIQALIIFILALSPAQLFFPDENTQHQDKRIDRAVEASHQFTMMWSLVWFAWCGMYTVMALAAFHQFFQGEGDKYALIVQDFFNISVTSLLFLCYLLLVRESADTHKGRWRRDVGAVIGISAIFFLAEAIVVIKQPEARAAFANLQGLFAGVGLALLAGRLEGRFINTARYKVVLFYAYAVLQLGYPQLTDPIAKLTITTAALILKVLLFFEVWRIITSPTLIYYMYRYKYLKDKEAEEREKFDKHITPHARAPHARKNPKRHRAQSNGHSDDE